MQSHDLWPKVSSRSKNITGALGLQYVCGHFDNYRTLRPKGYLKIHQLCIFKRIEPRNTPIQKLETVEMLITGHCIGLTVSLVVKSQRKCDRMARIWTFTSGYFLKPLINEISQQNNDKITLARERGIGIARVCLLLQLTRREWGLGSVRPMSEGTVSLIRIFDMWSMVKYIGDGLRTVDNTVEIDPCVNKH